MNRSAWLSALPLAAVIALALCRCAQGQTPAAAPPAWQPYRGSETAATAAAPPAVDRLAQAPMGEMAVCPEPMFTAPPYDMPPCWDAGLLTDSAVDSPELWQWRLLPEGVIWQSYWAGIHESRVSGVAFHDNNSSSELLDVTLGGRAALLRYGSEGAGLPQGWELQIEGAAFPRLNLNENWDLDAVDFRFGLPLVYGRDQWQTKFSYYHLSSHLGDELAIREMRLGDRINYSRDALVLGLSYFPLPAWRWYAEAEWAFHYDESEPWAFQFGVDIAEPGPTGPWGAPFIAINGHIREELDYGGNVVAQAGWFWRGRGTHTLRTGFQYFNGKSNQLEFFDQFEEQIGGGIWYEF